MDSSVWIRRSWRVKVSSEWGFGELFLEHLLIGPEMSQVERRRKGSPAGSITDGCYVLGHSPSAGFQFPHATAAALSCYSRGLCEERQVPQAHSGGSAN